MTAASWSWKLSPGRHADQVGVSRGRQVALHEEVEVGTAADRAGARRADPEVEHRVVVLGVFGLSPHLDQRSQPEGLRAVLHDHGHAAHGRESATFWREINGWCHFCHWWQEM